MFKKKNNIANKFFKKSFKSLNLLKKNNKNKIKNFINKKLNFIKIIFINIYIKLI